MRIGFLLLYLIKLRKMVGHRPITDSSWIVWILIAVGEYIGHVGLSVAIGFLLLYLIKRRKMVGHRPITDNS